MRKTRELAARDPVLRKTLIFDKEAQLRDISPLIL